MCSKTFKYMSNLNKLIASKKKQSDSIHHSQAKKRTSLWVPLLGYLFWAFDNDLFI